MGLLRQARPIIEDVSRQSRESAYVAVARAAAVVPLDVVEADSPVRIVVAASARRCRCTAPRSARCTRVRVGGGAEAATSPTAVSRSSPTGRSASVNALQQQLKGVAERGYAVDGGEHVEDVRAVAVPIRDYTRNVVGALAVAGPAYRLPAERIEKEIAPLVVKAGQDLSRRLGFDE